MKESLSIKTEQSVNQKEQDRFQAKQLETLASRLKEKQAGQNEEEREVFRKSLFLYSNIKRLLDASGVTAEEDLETIIQKIERHRTEILTEGGEVLQLEMADRVPVSDTEKRELIMSIQEELNGIYKVRDEEVAFMEAEKGKIKEALVKLQVFASDIPDIERVEVKRTSDGTIQVIFESEKSKVETLTQIAKDIRDSKERIEVYQREIEIILRNKDKGLLKRLFSSKKDDDAEDPEIQTWVLKISRTESELAGRIEQYEEAEDGILLQKHLKDEAMGIPLHINGIDEYKGEWKVLFDTLKDKSESFMIDLEKSVSRYDSQIAMMEARISGLETKAA